MRPLAIVLVVFLIPSAAAIIDLPAGREFRADATPGGVTTIDIPVNGAAGGTFYAKLLPTAGNAVNDGARPNGTIEPPTGWWIEFALVHAMDDTIALGKRVDSTPTDAVTLAKSETARLRVMIHQPADSAGGVVYVAIAERAPARDDGPSGASADESRAVTVRLDAPAGPQMNENDATRNGTARDVPAVGVSLIIGAITLAAAASGRRA